MHSPSERLVGVIGALCLEDLEDLDKICEVCLALGGRLFMVS